MTKDGYSCNDLIPNDIRLELDEKLRHILKKHRCKCQCMLTFRFLPIKHSKSSKTMVLLVLLFLFLTATHVMFVLPQSPAITSTYVITSIHVTLSIILIIAFLLSACRDPGYLKQEDDERLKIINLLRWFNPDDICPRCQVLTTPRS